MTSRESGHDGGARRVPGIPPPGAVVHLVGICGTGMAALAGLFKARGYVVRGSDANVYPPMSDLLRELGIPVAQGYDPGNLEPAPDLVVIGNVVRRDNPEARAVIEAGLPYLSLPEAVARLCLEDRASLVVAGTHGKTTTASLLVGALAGAGYDPGFLIGGVVRSHGRGFHPGAPPWFVLEGDEYDTAFFDKGPKFLHYRPQAVILTSLEFDHADIYPDLAAVKAAFRGLVALLPPDGLLVACSDWPDVLEVAAGAAAPVVTYGTGPGADWRLESVEVGPDGTAFQAVAPGGRRRAFTLALPGAHNALNALAVAALCDGLGVEPEGAARGLAACRGVRRRQEVRGEAGGVTVIDDFAHHPTAVRVTLEALRAAYPGRRLLVAFEPRTNTSRRKVFQEAYARAFDAADRVWVREVPDPEKVPAAERFSSRRLVADLETRGVAAGWFPDAGAIADDLVAACRPGDVVAVLSNGAFEGLHERLLRRLAGGAE
ncbi:UDP-N-acetylmuramate:L-alanyl-gamma-D-glutamyl-meso-diaminopimelate ligase [Dissulfurirhabdus thermomarina]|uniref:UDP-N-acetylmuramate:L-alanyl-gamma-D-glutamyl-meso-diaminopimelate ligase n=1 Tax=Dissulfurirhabdus thermomarina TaxID=1765737 RepID=A0A6N9TQ54_DISTH|nr:UDP-N-acetylmuramate:L-alanyl-gamma-D-glutamyl-meso-diaminopimelate ligase [Dissulfurirhabdus thermomarina]NDY43178.1 UDP-N-acetylmuramate:L-alanyl-gamma-D-glutamyl-meso-diaminopimelate ligase [Dissulfurirhabdus thermomarina]NMX22790.1 UDP-N-acetylmuramate:L-alanyl-gamma-D-glutamyl-meso-diaminopimelate ligase [Dissulfurirhabdus thermomarina]